MKIENLFEKLNNFSKLSLQESWDNSGIQLLIDNSEIRKIILTLDITGDVIDFAKEKNANLIISHHPLIFSGLKSLNYKNKKDNIIIKAVKHNINIFSFHTNIDKSINGLVDYFCKKIGLMNTEPLATTSYEKLYKVVTFIPEEFLDIFLQLIKENNFSVIGKYRVCSFHTSGTGTFLPVDNAKPFSGEKNKLNKVKEFRIEIQESNSALYKVINVIKSNHPYEEPVIDIYPLNQKGKFTGALGRVGYLDKEIDSKNFIQLLKKIFNISTIKVSGFREGMKIKKVAVCPGSGMSLIKNVISSGADVYITGDVKYHEALDSAEMNLLVIDMGHFGSEFIFTELMRDYLLNLNLNVEIYNQKDVFKYF